jgi:hypothetical protein
MKRVVGLISVALLIFACEGEQGPMGPAGPSGTSVVIVTGIVAEADYIGDFIRVYSDYITHDAVVQVHMTRDPVHYSWHTVSEFYLYTGRISIYDPAMDYSGYYYQIKIICENSDS